MQRRGLRLLILLLLSFGAWIAATCQQAVSTNDESHSALAALTRLFGQPIVDASVPTFESPQYRLVPTFSKEGVLISLKMDANPRLNSNDLTRSDFDRLLVLLDSVKPLGKYEENGGGITHGWRAYMNRRYDYAYLYTTEPIIGPDPPPVQSAVISYIHPVSGAGRLPAASKPMPGFVCSFCIVCVNGEAYTAPSVDFHKVVLKPNEVQLLNLAGPSGDKSACTEKPLDPAPAEKPKSGDKVLLLSVPATSFQRQKGIRDPREGDFLSDFNPEDQEAIAAVIGKPVLLVGFDSEGRAEVQFTDAHGKLHFLYVEPNQIKAMGASERR